MENDKKEKYPEFEKNSVEKIKDCLQDYSNDFTALKMTLLNSGIKKVREVIKSGYKVATVEEYLEKYRKANRETIGLEEQKNPIFIEKAKILNKLANKINSFGEKIDGQTILETVEQVKKIVF
jgi:predicted ATP-grasp superfamily ATP-dependent carboligase